MKKTAALKTLNKLSKVENHFLCVVFAKSPSAGFESALFLARAADQFWIEEISKRKELYLAAYNDNANSISKAVLLMKQVATWKSSMFFLNRAPKGPGLWQILECYQRALTSQNTKAYCSRPVTVVPATGVLNGPSEVVVSCRLAVINGVLTEGIELTLEDQLSGGAAYFGCEACPLYKCEVIRPIPGPIRYW